MQFKYTGNTEVTFPSIAKVVQPNEVFEAPDDFTAHNVEPATPTDVTDSPTDVPTATVGE